MHPCNQCDYVCAKVEELKHYELSIHDIGGHPCDQNQCVFKGSSIKQLKKHQLILHGVHIS